MPAKPLAVPSDHGIGPHDDQGRSPILPRLGEQDPKQSIACAEVRTPDRAPKNRQLLTQRHVRERDGSVFTLRANRSENQPAGLAIKFWRPTSQQPWNGVSMCPAHSVASIRRREEVGGMRVGEPVSH